MPDRRRALRCLRDGALLVCPSCRSGRIFRGWEILPACADCGAPFQHDAGEFTGPLMFGMGFVALLALMGWFVLQFFTPFPDVVGWAWLAWWSVVFPLAFYRNLKGLWVGILYAARGPEQPLGVGVEP